MPRGKRLCPCGSGEIIGCRSNGCSKCSKGKEKPRAAKKTNGTNGKHHAEPGMNGDGRLTLRLSAEAIERQLEGMDLESYVRAATPEVKARIFELLMEP